MEYIADQIDFRIEAKGVTPIPAVSSARCQAKGRHSLPPTRRIVSNFAKSSEADPNGLSISQESKSGGAECRLPINHDSRQNLTIS